MAPAGLATRPTSDRLRETLFNVLAPRFLPAPASIRFLDLFAGSGAVGLEALSRGAAHVEFVERSAPALAILRKNLASLQITAGVSIHAASVDTVLKRMRAAKPAPAPFDIVFLDPPYDAAEAYHSTLLLLGGECASLLAPQALVIAEHRRKQQLVDLCGKLRRTRLLEQGDAALSFFAGPPAP